VKMFDAFDAIENSAIRSKNVISIGCVEKKNAFRGR
jgi:hypothetical protein